VERIEVLKDGASAIYGSDAMAGVVNIITRSNVTGVTANVYHGQYSQGDGARDRFDVVAGWSRPHLADPRGRTCRRKGRVGQGPWLQRVRPDRPPCRQPDQLDHHQPVGPVHRPEGPPGLHNSSGCNYSLNRGADPTNRPTTTSPIRPGSPATSATPTSRCT
jgi:iron complex outermembrane receptor protein